MKNTFLYIALLSSLFTSTIYAADENIGGIDHLALSVSDLDASTEFFVGALGFDISGRDAEYPAVFMNNGKMTLTLWQTGDQSVAFNRKSNVGLHHLAISVTSFDALNELYEKLKKLPGVVIEFAPELAYGGPTKHMMIREPSGNRLELVHRPKK